MLLGHVFKPFIEASPISVMVRGLLENALDAKRIDALSEEKAKGQYTRELLFSTLVRLMSLVVFRIRPSVHASYQSLMKQISVSVISVYNKLKGVEPAVSAELIRYSGCQLAPIIHQMKGALPPLLPGYRVKILDGNSLSGTEHRLRVLRQTAAGALPGKSLLVLDPCLMLVVDAFLCEDGDAQERSLLGEVLKTVEPKDVWIGDRNFCTTRFLFGIVQKQGFFIIRQHGNSLHWEVKGGWKSKGSIDSGRVAEQPIELWDEEGRRMRVRRVRLCLKRPTRDGDQVPYILTNLPEKQLSAPVVANLYRKRWTLENAFHFLTKTLRCEINTLGYPPAALFGFSLAVVAYNILSAVRAALRSVHGGERVEEEVSSYYPADDIGYTYGGMMVAIAPRHWALFRSLSVAAMAQKLQHLARHVQLERYRRHPRGPKKPKKPISRENAGHVSTARLLAAAV